jgi:hypothetical protein
MERAKRINGLMTSAGGGSGSLLVPALLLSQVVLCDWQDAELDELLEQ